MIVKIYFYQAGFWRHEWQGRATHPFSH